MGVKVQEVQAKKPGTDAAVEKSLYVDLEFDAAKTVYEEANKVVEELLKKDNEVNFENEFWNSTLLEDDLTKTDEEAAKWSKEVTELIEKVVSKKANATVVKEKLVNSRKALYNAYVTLHSSLQAVGGDSTLPEEASDDSTSMKPLGTNSLWEKLWHPISKAEGIES